MMLISPRARRLETLNATQVARLKVQEQEIRRLQAKFDQVAELNAELNRERDRLAVDLRRSADMNAELDAKVTSLQVELRNAQIAWQAYEKGEKNNKANYEKIRELVHELSAEFDRQAWYS